MASVARLVEATIVPDLAIEIAAQINAGIGNHNRLSELGMTTALARELAFQISNGAKAGRLVELGLPAVPAREISLQISNGPAIPLRALTYSDGTPLTYSDGVYLEYSA